MPEENSEETVTAESDSESTADRSEAAPGRGTDEPVDDPATGATDLEERVGSFLDLEASLARRAGTARARVVDAETVPADAVPAGYPRPIEGETALALTLELDRPEDRTRAYFEWPPSDGSPLARLLTALDVGQDSFADLHGRRLLVHLEDEYVLPVVPPAGPDGSRYGAAGVVAGHLANAAAVVGAMLGVVEPLTLFTALVLVTLLVLPTATYLDAWYLKRTTDWDQAPSFWASLAAIPLVNLASTVLYFRDRRSALPISGP